MTNTTRELVEVRCISPVAGSYVCKLGEHDHIGEEVAQRDDGSLYMKAVPKKRFSGLVPFERWATSLEIEALEAGRSLPPNLALVIPLDKLPRTKNGRLTDDVRVVELAPNFKLPPDVAEDLVKRGLVEIVTVPAEQPGG